MLSFLSHLPVRPPQSCHSNVRDGEPGKINNKANEEQQMQTPPSFLPFRESSFVTFLVPCLLPFRESSFVPFPVACPSVYPSLYPVLCPTAHPSLRATLRTTLPAANASIPHGRTPRASSSSPSSLPLHIAMRYNSRRAPPAARRIPFVSLESIFPSPVVATVTCRIAGAAILTRTVAAVKTHRPYCAAAPFALIASRSQSAIVASVYQRHSPPSAIHCRFAIRNALPRHRAPQRPPPTHSM